MSFTWEFDVPDERWKNPQLKARLYEAAAFTPWAELYVFPQPPLLPWNKRLWRSVRWWIDDHWPRVHLGSCNHEDCR